MSDHRRILGLDPSLGKGLGCVIIQSDAVEVFTLGVIKSMSMDERIVDLAKTVGRLIRRNEIDAVGIEGQFAPLGGKAKEGETKQMANKRRQNTARSADRLANLAGGIKVVCDLEGVTCVEIAPATGKKALTGNGRATPLEMDTEARKLYPNLISLTDDQAHALGVALATQAKLEDGRDE
ncbi:MAG: hypothetical protein KAJ19_23065 [Gammaproteobacteria bacterium]|nr:hypothetical protein [Gammaproteobacteria bacterium]